MMGLVDPAVERLFDPGLRETIAIRGFLVSVPAERWAAFRDGCWARFGAQVDEPVGRAPHHSAGLSAVAWRAEERDAEARLRELHLKH